MSSVPAADEIWKDARWLVQALDPNAGLVRLVEMSRETYRSASFLDDRLLQPGTKAQLVPWGSIASSAPDGVRSDARWIFHISHVGSTLVSRLLGELDGVLALREPRSVYDLTFFPGEVRERFVPALERLLSRTFAPGETAVVKATSFAAEIASELASGSPALFLYMEPRRFIQAMLAGDNSRQSLRTLSQQRAQRMHARVGVLEDAERSDAHLAAAAWACEMTALEASAEQMGHDKVLWADFDRMLDDMEHGLARTAAFFGFDAPPAKVRELVSGPLMRSYSKAPEFQFSPAVRNELLAKAERDHRFHIDDALVMLARAANNAPLLQRALDRCSPES